MKHTNNKELNGYILSASNLVNYNGVKNIVITDGVESLHIQYKGKEYVFDLEKALSLLCKELEK